MKTRQQTKSEFKHTRSGLAWNNQSTLRVKKNRSTGDILRLRVNSSKDVKTSFKIHADKIKVKKPGADITLFLSPKVRAECTKTGTYRPIIFSPNQSAYTPDSKTRMYPRLKLGPLDFYSSEPDETCTKIKPIELKQINDEFYQSDVYRNICDIKAREKSLETTITKSSLDKVKAQRLQSGGKRVISQNKAMAAEGVSEKFASASRYAQCAIPEIKNIRWEWLHLVAHSIMGDAAQFSGNLVCGSAELNTSNELINRHIAELAKAYPSGFTLKASAELLPDTQIASNMRYVIITPDFELEFEFDASVAHKPHIDYWEYIKYFFEQLVALSKSCSDKENLSLSCKA